MTFKLTNYYEVKYTEVFMGIGEQKVRKMRAVNEIEVVNQILASHVGTQYAVASIDEINKI